MIRHVPLFLMALLPLPVACAPTGTGPIPTEPVTRNGDLSGAAPEACYASDPVRFETPCALKAGEADFVSQVQRALAARGLYDGAISGQYDRPTRAAVRAYQAEDGPDSGMLSIASAKRLGLVALGRDGV